MTHLHPEFHNLRYSKSRIDYSHAIKIWWICKTGKQSVHFVLRKCQLHVPFSTHLLGLQGTKRKENISEVEKISSFPRYFSSSYSPISRVVLDPRVVNLEWLQKVALGGCISSAVYQCFQTINNLCYLCHYLFILTYLLCHYLWQLLWLLWLSLGFHLWCDEHKLEHKRFSLNIR